MKVGITKLYLCKPFVWTSVRHKVTIDIPPAQAQYILYMQISNMSRQFIVDRLFIRIYNI